MDNNLISCHKVLGKEFPRSDHEKVYNLIPNCISNIAKD